MGEIPSYKTRVENELPKPQWEKPLLNTEINEMKITAEKFGINLQILIDAFNKADLQELSDEDWLHMDNTESVDVTWTIEQVREELEGRRDFASIEKRLRNGDKVYAPVVLYRENQAPYLIGGNSRLLGCRVLGIQPTVLAIRL